MPPPSCISMSGKEFLISEITEKFIEEPSKAPSRSTMCNLSVPFSIQNSAASNGFS